MSYQMIFLKKLLFELFLSFWLILQIAMDVVNFILIEFYCVFLTKKTQCCNVCACQEACNFH